MQVVTNRLMGTGKASQTKEQQFHLELEELRGQSTSFDSYILNSCVLETLANAREDLSSNGKAIWHM